MILIRNQKIKLSRLVKREKRKMVFVLSSTVNCQGRDLGYVQHLKTMNFPKLVLNLKFHDLNFGPSLQR